jgi:hypothetical protein
VASRKHAREVTALVVEAFLGLGENGHAGEGGVAEAAADAARRDAVHIAGEIRRRDPLEPDTMRRLLARVRERQRAVGYGGDFAAWMARMTPPDLE